MAVETATDRAVFVSSDEFGVDATYAKAGGGSAVLSGILDEPHLAVDLGNGSISDANPTFFCRSADIPSGAAGGDSGDTLTISGDTFDVVDLEPDGQGMTRIRLGK